MKKLTPLALSVTLALSLPMLAHANNAAPVYDYPAGNVDDGLSAGLDMMLLNTSPLRNGDSVWTRAREGFQMAEVNPELVRRHERNFAGKAAYFKRTMDRGRKYLFHIMNEVERRGMPTEIAFLPVVESAFVPGAQSQVGASGLWQFMPATGRQYGLEQTWWYDGRRDVTESTRAALDYLQNLYTMFGDWSLALAAYNWGEGNLSRAIAKVRARGEVETYENIQMPAETRNYVPKLLAVRNIMLEPEKFGLKLDPFPNKPTFVATSNGRHMNIDIAAKLAEMPVAEFKELNPAFNLPVYAHKPGRQMLLPATKLHKFETNLAKWDKPLLTWQVFVPENDTTTGELASQFDMNPNELITANNLKGSALAAGRPVLVALRNNSPAPALESTDIPAQPAESATLVAFAANAGPMDTPKAVAEPAKPAPQPDTIKTAEATPLRTLQKAEPARSDASPRPEPATVRVATRTEAVAAPGRNEPRFEPIRAELVKPEVVKVAAKAETAGSLGDNIPVSNPDKVVSASASLHTVAAGDTLYNISRRYSMSVTDLRSLNSLQDDTVKLGQILKVIGTSSNAVASATDSSALRPASYSRPATAVVAVDYVVQRGDTVFSIARKFGVAHTDILRWNNPEQLANLQPGQKVRVQNTGL
ncbi:LysM peptidoglycan-binding domain-containing protein [Vogesella sp. DC21W]|uniref:LysM peptidoglycan-binding domain-containing protein n=1 Tax=Vogesella aquatica TaxID=2984206 RepID=A0ABT5IVG0_9NEIS|nr:LysM peptidoglycan-binding domain-containing protein [Vogesella aquatica]MDC7716503.1 LysM peptidoglycan-binding domain-containing protein [Vogesella aquatica]